MRPMENEATRFRKRAETCRGRAREARDAIARDELTEIADELEVEADMMEAEERTLHRD